MRITPALRCFALMAISCTCLPNGGRSLAQTPQTPPQEMPDAPSQNAPNQTRPAPQQDPVRPLSTRPRLPADQEKIAADQRASEALRISKLAIINGRPYDQPSNRDTLIDYAKDSYLLPALFRSTARALYGQALDKPVGWGQDFPGYMQRQGSSMAITAINGNVRLAMELTFHEDLRYLPCHGCSVRRKIENALLSEVTARHDVNGHRFFTLTPTIADFSGPIIAHSYWYPKGFNPFAGVVATRLVFATRVGQHLFEEFVMERRHRDTKIPD